MAADKSKDARLAEFLRSSDINESVVRDVYIQHKKDYPESSLRLKRDRITVLDESGSTAKKAEVPAPSKKEEDEKGGVLVKPEKSGEGGSGKPSDKAAVASRKASPTKKGKKKTRRSYRSSARSGGGK